MNEAAPPAHPLRDALKRPAVLALIGLIVLPLVVFLPQALGLKVFYHHDLQFYFYPYHKVAVDILKSGHLPLWNPYAFCGMPLIGDGQTALFYPLNWLYLIIEASRALTLGIVLNFSVAALGMILFARQVLKLGLLGTSIATIAFMFNGFLVARMGHPSIMAGASLVPLVFWAADRLLEQRSAHRFILLAAVLAMQLLTGHPQIPVYTAMSIGIYAIVLLTMECRATRSFRCAWGLLWIVGAYVLAVGIAAIQVLPWMELIAHSPRAAGVTYEFLTADSLTGIGWLLMVFPYELGGMIKTPLQAGAEWSIPVYSGERLGYIGILPLMLALYAAGGLFRRRAATISASPRKFAFFRNLEITDARWFALAIVAVVMLFTAAGSGTPFGRIVYLIPLVGKLRCYARAVGVASFALAALAGIGAEKLSRDQRGIPLARRLRPVYIAAGVLVIMLLCLLIVPAIEFKSPYRSLERINTAFHESLSFTKPNGYMPLIFAMGSVVALMFAALRMSRPAAIALFAIAAIDCAGFAWSFCPSTTPDVFTSVPPSVEFLKKQPEPYRVAVYLGDDHIEPQIAKRQLAVSWALPFGIEDINGFNSLQLRRHMDFLFGAAAMDISYGALPDVNGVLLHAPSNRLNLLDAHFAMIPSQFPVKTGAYWQKVYRDDAVTILENPAPYGRGFFPKQVVSNVADEVALSASSDTDFPSRLIAFVDGMDERIANALTVATEGDPHVVRQSASDLQLVDPNPRIPKYDSRASVRFTKRSPNEIEFETTADASRLLVLSEIYFPGWHAERIVEGGYVEPVDIERVNYLFRGVVVPDGTHQFRMFYRPNYFYLGALISLMSIAGCGLSFISARRARVRDTLTGIGAWFRQTFAAATFVPAIDPLPLDRTHSDRWLSNSLLVIAATCLGIGLQVRNGLYNPAALGLLAAACACAIAAVCVPALRPWPARWPRPDLIVMGIAIPLYFALMHGMLPGIFMSVLSFEVFRTFPIILSIVAVLAGSALGARPPLGRLTMPAIILLYLILGTWLIHISAAPLIDVYLFQRDAAEAILHGHNPYALTFRNIYMGGGDWVYAKEVLRGDRLMFGYPYMPLTLLFTTPAHFFLNDYRYGQLLAMALSALLIAYARPSRMSMLAAILLLFSPRSFFILEQGWTEPIVILLLAATLFCAIRLPRVMPYALGLFLVSKQYMPAAILVAPMLILRENWSRPKTWLPILWRAILAGAIVSLPLVLINPAAFWHSAISLQFKQPFRYDAMSFLAWLSDPQFEMGTPPHGSPPPYAAGIAFLALVLGAALVLWRGRPSPRWFVVGVAFMFLLFFAFNKQAFANYYFFVIGAIWCAVALQHDGAGAESKPRIAVPGST